MITLLKNKFEQYSNKIDRYNYLREYLQLVILKILDEKGYFRNIAFVGGTALRIIYDLKRFSEDLDFCLVNKRSYSFDNIAKTLHYELAQNNLEININTKSDKNVATMTIKFLKLLFDLGLSKHKEERLTLKIEVDQKPPKGFELEFTMLNKEFIIGINHYDLPSLFASKLHAVLYRKYTKGRDYYDLLWYLGKMIQPNYELLQAAIYQTEKIKLKIDREKLISLLEQKIDATNFAKIRSDVAPFLEDNGELRLFDSKYFLAAIRNIKNNFKL